MLDTEGEAHLSEISESTVAFAEKKGDIDTLQGWRARIGIIFPADGLVDHEFSRFAPEGVSVHITRVRVPAGTLLQVVTKLAETEDIEEAARTLTAVRPSVITYACTAASFVRGITYDVQIARRIEAASGCPASTTSTSLVRALKRLDIKTVAVGTPYLEKEVNARLRKFLEDNGFKVDRLTELGLADDKFHNASESTVYQFGKKVNTPQSDGIFLACTALPTADVLEPLEEDLRKPVVSANQATMWDALRMAKVNAQINGYGTLLRVL
jgi:maleate isomerase